MRISYIGSDIGLGNLKQGYLLCPGDVHKYWWNYCSFAVFRFDIDRNTPKTREYSSRCLEKSWRRV